MGWLGSVVFLEVVVVWLLVLVFLHFCLVHVSCPRKINSGLNVAASLWTACRLQAWDYSGCVLPPPGTAYRLPGRLGRRIASQTGPLSLGRRITSEDELSTLLVRSLLLSQDEREEKVSAGHSGWATR